MGVGVDIVLCGNSFTFIDVERHVTFSPRPLPSSYPVPTRKGAIVLWSEIVINMLSKNHPPLETT